MANQWSDMLTPSKSEPEIVEVWDMELEELQDELVEVKKLIKKYKNKKESV